MAEMVPFTLATQMTLSPQRKFFGFAFGRKFGLSGKFYEVGHEIFQNDEIALPSFARPDSRGGCPHVA